MGRGLAIVCFSLLAVLALAGCASKTDSSSSATKASSGSATVAAAAGNVTNHAPVIQSFKANVTGLKAKFAVNATDADKDNLTYMLSFGDKTANLTGRLPALSLNHTYLAAGNFTARLVVSDGKLSVNKTLPVKALAVAAGPVQEDSSMSGTVMCLPTEVVSGSIQDGSNTLAVKPGQTKLTLTLSYSEDTGTEDLDLTITDPAGTVTKSAASGPEPPVVFANPLPGDWKITVKAFSCVATLDYTITAHFG